MEVILKGLLLLLLVEEGAEDVVVVGIQVRTI